MRGLNCSGCREASYFPAYQEAGEAGVTTENIVLIVQPSLMFPLTLGLPSTAVLSQFQSVCKILKGVKTHGFTDTWRTAQGIDGPTGQTVEELYPTPHIHEQMTAYIYIMATPFVPFRLSNPGLTGSPSPPRVLPVGYGRIRSPLKFVDVVQMCGCCPK